jgi:hypothetical protein
MARPTRRVVGVVAVMLGLAVFAFGCWMVFDLSYQITRESRASSFHYNLFRIFYGLLGGFALYAVGSYLVRSSRKPPSASGPAPAPVVVVKMRCLTCRQLNDEDSKFCKQCGHVV